MNRIVLALAGSLVFFGASQAAPRAESQICEAMKSAISQNGVLTLRFRGRDTRFVKHQGFCRTYGRLQWQYVRARDGRCALKLCERVTSRGGN